MTYARELDDLPWEATRAVATTFGFWPKVDGENVRAASSPTVQIYDPSGNLISSSTGTVADSGTPSVSRISFTVPAQTDLEEKYSAHVTWRVFGSTEDRQYIRLFDVVLYPFGGPAISLNDLLEVRPDIGYVLDRIGTNLLGFASNGREQAAAVFALQARIELETMVRTSMVAQGENLRPALILRRERLARVERLLAVALVYESIADNPGGGEADNDAPGPFYRRQAEAAFRSLGPLEYDRTEDLVPDTTLPNLGRVTFTRRVQG